jgi:hypothetical protein
MPTSTTDRRPSAEISGVGEGADASLFTTR